jgi:nucleoside-diphosphate-sugar epimerase
VRADARDAAAARAASAGAAVVYHCANVPYVRWADELPGLLDAILGAATDTGAALVYCDNLYAYGPAAGPLHEGLPQAASGPKGALRARLADRVLAAHARGTVRATIGRASDFYGPGAGNTAAEQLVVGPLLAGARPRWLGTLDAPHTFAFVDDVARGLAALGADARARGAAWHIPAAEPLTGRAFLALAGRVIGGTAVTRALHPDVVGRTKLRLGALRDANLRELLETLHQFEHPWLVDATRWTRTLGDFPVTPHEAALRQTIDGRV